MPLSPEASRLQLLGFAVEEALADEKFDEMFALLGERDACISQMVAEGTSLSPEESEVIRSQNEHLARRLRAAQSVVAQTARINVQAAKAAKAYQS